MKLRGPVVLGLVPTHDLNRNKLMFHTEIFTIAYIKVF